MFKAYSKNNQGHKMAAPKKSDAAKAPKALVGQSAGQLGNPVIGQDFIHGFAVIPVSRKFKASGFSYGAHNPTGWLLIGGQWTDDAARVQESAAELDRLIRLAGGVNLPMEAA